MEELSEDNVANAVTLDKLSRGKDLMLLLAQDIFPSLIRAYRENFTLEEFLRKLHNQDSDSSVLLQTHEDTLDALDALLCLFGDLTALTADEQYLAQSPHQN